MIARAPAAPRCNFAAGGVGATCPLRGFGRDQSVHGQPHWYTGRISLMCITHEVGATDAALLHAITIDGQPSGQQIPADRRLCVLTDALAISSKTNHSWYVISRLAGRSSCTSRCCPDPCRPACLCRLKRYTAPPQLAAPTMLHASGALVAGLALLVVVASPAACYWGTDSSWTDARATFYGRDGWSVDTGSCGFGFICPNRQASSSDFALPISSCQIRPLQHNCGARVYASGSSCRRHMQGCVLVAKPVSDLLCTVYFFTRVLYLHRYTQITAVYSRSLVNIFACRPRISQSNLQVRSAQVVGRACTGLGCDGCLRQVPALRQLRVRRSLA